MEYCSIISDTIDPWRLVFRAGNPFILSEKNLSFGKVDEIIEDFKERKELYPGEVLDLNEALRIYKFIKVFMSVFRIDFVDVEKND